MSATARDDDAVTCQKTAIQSKQQLQTKFQSGSPSRNGSSSGYLKVLLPMVSMLLLITYVETMIIPGIPVIRNYFSTTTTIASWISTAFLIMGAATTPLFGKLGDIYGNKKILLVVLSFYTAGVGIAGFATSIYVLIAARAISGIGWAMLPLSLAMVTKAFPKEKLATAQSALAAVSIMGTVAGYTIGAYVIQDLGWRYAFYTALALSVVLFALLIKLLKSDQPSSKAKVDYVGAALLSSGIVLVLVYLTEGPTSGWLSWNLAFLIPGLALTLGFFAYENRIANPLMQLSLMRIRNVLVANLIAVLSGMALFLGFLAIVYYAETPPPFGLGLDIQSTGLTLVPATIAVMAVAPVLGKSLAKVGPKPIIIFSSLILMLGFALFMVYRATQVELAIDMIVAYVGAICVTIPLVNMISVASPSDSISVSQGINAMLKTLGQSIGPIISATVLASYTAPLVETVNGHTITSQLPSATAFNIIAAVAIGIAIVVMVIGFATKNYKLAKKEAGRGVEN